MLDALTRAENGIFPSASEEPPLGVSLQASWNSHPQDSAHNCFIILMIANVFRTLLGAPGIATRNKKPLGAPGHTTRSKNATINVSTKPNLTANTWKHDHRDSDYRVTFTGYGMVYPELFVLWVGPDSVSVLKRTTPIISNHGVPQPSMMRESNHSAPWHHICCHQHGCIILLGCQLH